MDQKYALYVGSFTDTNDCPGLTVFDADPVTARLQKKEEIEVSNASYLAISPDGRILYSLTDLGIISFRILPDGSLQKINIRTIRGMRGCHISTSRDGRYVFVSGFHDGKITVLKTKPDGAVDGITDGVFHKGPGSVAERNFVPHVRCSRLTPDEKYLCSCDSGLDQVWIYRFDAAKGTLSSCDILRCPIQSGPRHLLFTSDGRFMYLISELSSQITVYSYEDGGDRPVFTLLQSVSTLGKHVNDYSAAVALKLSEDENTLFCTNAGSHSVGVFRRDLESGLLTQLNVLPISGRYPTEVVLFPDGEHLCCTNQDSDSLTTFHVNTENGLIVMCAAPIQVDQPRCALMVKLPAEAEA